MLLLLRSGSFRHHVLRRWRRRIVDCFWKVSAHVRWLSTEPIWSNSHAMRMIRGRDFWLGRTMVFHGVAPLSIHRFRDHRLKSTQYDITVQPKRRLLRNFKAQSLP